MEFYVFFISSNGTIDFKTILATSKEHAISYFNEITSNNNFTNNGRSPIFIKSIYHVEINTITSCIFTNNSNISSSIFCLNSKLSILLSTFKENYASDYSGIVDIENSTVNMENIIFMSNYRNDNYNCCINYLYV